ncbi:uncharacterized protein LOC123529272 [Mercenaria mercenaria]|uniref:uncharacterized protein LOC123529272 n=1 Tax=Mercenaria mercenaria TaxID=6596 RepID=UPI00234F3CF9|nr:uncharacterized protein LOC123529272 [Mercenaria mercenaria]
MKTSLTLLFLLLARTISLPTRNSGDIVTQPSAKHTNTSTITKPATKSALSKTEDELLALTNLTPKAAASIKPDVNVTPHNTTLTKPEAMPGLPTVKPLTPDNQSTFDVPYVAASVLKNCQLIPEDKETTSLISEALISGTKMIKFHLHIKRPERKFHGYNESNLYKPFFWVRSTGRHGTGLLLLRPAYDMLSLTTLELGVETMHVNITEHPSYCLSQLSYSDIEVLVRELVMNDFQNTSSGVIVKLKPTDNVCNMHVTDADGVADFRYLCCQRSETHHVRCSYLQSDAWLNVLFTVIVVLKVLVVLFSPRLIPDSFYRLKHVAAPYIHRLQQPLSVKAVVTTNPEQFTNVKNKFELTEFREMKKFKTTLQNMTLDVPYTLIMKQVHLRIKYGRLLPEDFAPVGLFRTMYDSFFKCKIRERVAVAECCKSNFFLFSKCHSETMSWYTVLKRFMTAILLLLLATPWIIRIYVYFQYEHSEMHMRKDAAYRKSLRFYFPGNFTLLLTPLHVLFVLIYLLLSFESCVFGVMSRKMKERFKFVLRKCFRDMRETKQMDVVGWVVKVAVKPCTLFGGVGICIGLVTWTLGLPFLLLILSFYIFPTLNITLRLLAHFAVYLFPRNACNEIRILAKLSRLVDNIEQKLEMKDISRAESLEKKESVLNSGSKRLQQLVVILLCLLSMYSVIFLMTEFASFIVEIFVYTLMGLILNASMTLTYISLIFLLGVYGSDCFGIVSKKFLAFNKTMISAILQLGKDKVENEIYCDEEKQENIAFRIKTERAETVENPVQLATNEDGLPRWQVSRVVLFLSKNDRPMIPKSFYFKSCKMPFYSVPGELLVNYLRATAEFGMILLFLMFVLVVVLAFGDTYEISATNKLLATVAGGFLPFILKKAVFKSHEVPEIDIKNMNFQVCLHELMEDYQQTWPIYDIDVINKQILDNNSNLDTPEEFNETEIPVFDETNSEHKDSVKTKNQPIDLLIHIAGEIDSDDFPGMSTERPGYNGSTTFLEPDENELKEILNTS